MPRKPKYSEPMVRREFRLPNHLDRRIRDEARKTGRPESELIRSAVQEALNEPATAA